jgi:hypothetical protein
LNYLRPGHGCHKCLFEVVGIRLCTDLSNRSFIAFAPASIPYLNKTQLDPRIIFVTVVLSILCGALFGLAPALQKPGGGMLSGRAVTSASHATVRQWLVVAQIAASMVLLAGAMLLLRSFRNLENQHLGMRTDNTLTASITLGQHTYPTPASQFSFFQQLTTRLRFGPGITLVSISDSLPPAAGHFGGRLDEIVVAGRSLSTAGITGVVASRLVSPEYFGPADQNGGRLHPPSHTRGRSASFFLSDLGSRFGGFHSSATDDLCRQRK